MESLVDKQTRSDLRSVYSTGRRSNNFIDLENKKIAVCQRIHTDGRCVCV